MSPVKPSNPDRQSVTKLNQAVSLHQQGRLHDALASYQQVLRADANNFDALNGVGILYGQLGDFENALRFITKASVLQPANFAVHYNQGKALQELMRYEEAIASYDRALSLKPDFPEAYNNRGNALRCLRQYAQALASFENAIFLNPNNAEAHLNRGNVLREVNQYQEALTSYGRVLALNPRYAAAYNNQGLVLRNMKRHEDALKSYDQAIALSPNYIEAYYNRGDVLHDLKRHEDAVASYDRAIALKPDYAEAYINRGVALQSMRRYADALQSYDRTIFHKPDFAEAYYNRGVALRNLTRYEEALKSYDQAIVLKPDFAEAYSGRGITLRNLKRYDDALKSFERATALQPDHAEAHYFRSLLKLLLGDYQEGWQLHEWRWKTDQLQAYVRNFKQPLWLGDPSVRNQTILLHAEQGLGDVIQFVRYVPMVEALGNTVILEVPPTLVRLLSTLRGTFTLVATGDVLPEFDRHCPLMSLPLAFNTAIETIPVFSSYLYANQQHAQSWARRLKDFEGLRVGLVWAGGIRPRQVEAMVTDAHRSLHLSSLAVLADIPGVHFFSLQKGPPSSQLTELRQVRWAGPEIVDYTHELNDWADTAALVANLDLVISCDTSTAHLAAAMGKPTWILNRYDTCWRWLLERDDSPWYPSVRLFRQQSSGDWSSVLEHVQAELIRLATHKV